MNTVNINIRSRTVMETDHVYSISSSSTCVVDTFEEFKLTLRRHEVQTNTKYVMYKGDKTFTEEKVEPTSKNRIHWNGDTPYYIFGCRTYMCHQGRDINAYQKKKYNDLRDELESTGHTLRKRYNKTKGSKKLGCPAQLNVRRIRSLPNYRVSKITKSKKFKAADTIKTMLDLRQDIGGIDCYVFDLPEPSAHKFHDVVDPSITPFIVERHEDGTYEFFTCSTEPEVVISTSVANVAQSQECTIVDDGVQPELTAGSDDGNHEDVAESRIAEEERNKRELLQSCEETLLSIQSEMATANNEALVQLQSSLDVTFKVLLQSRMQQDSSAHLTGVEKLSCLEKDGENEKPTLERKKPQQRKRKQQNNNSAATTASNVVDVMETEISVRDLIITQNEANDIQYEVLTVPYFENVSYCDTNPGQDFHESDIVVLAVRPEPESSLEPISLPKRKRATLKRRANEK